MKISTLSYSAKEGIKNIYRNRLYSMASIGTIAACLFIFGLFYIVVVNFQFMFQSIEQQVGISVLFDEGISQEQIERIGQSIREREEVASITYVSPEDAWEKFKKDYFNDMEELLEGFDQDNPLKDSSSYEIHLTDIEQQSSFVKYVENLSGVRKVNHSQSAAESLVGFNMLLAYISISISVILLCVSVFLISNTVMIGITVRKEEISIMKLIGATDFFVRSPFIVEGIFIGGVGAALPLLLIYFTYNRVVTYLTTEFNILSNLLSFVPASYVFATLVPLSLIIGIGIGFIGSYGTVRRHLDV